MSRDRYQHGWVEEVGKQRKKWKGHYYIYVQQPDGTEKRIHHAPILGLKSEMRKGEAQKTLQEIIGTATAGVAVKPSSEYTFRWFWEQRFRPMKEPTWKLSSAPKTVWFIQNYVVKPFHDVPLGNLERFQIQTHLNTLANQFSRSVVVNFRTYINAILDEALEQGFITKNPARKLVIPRTRKPTKRVLTLDEIAQLLDHMSGRDRLIVRMFLALGLRPGELFALRRNDRLANNTLRIDESLSPTSGLVEPKTQASAACVWIPRSLAIELSTWADGMADKRPEAFLFQSRSPQGTPISPNNFLKRTLKKAAERTCKAILNCSSEVPKGFLEGLNFQALRRSCATHMQDVGSVKDIQAHLRHARPNVTAEVYMQEIPSNVRAAVEALDAKLSCSGVEGRIQLNTIEHEILPRSGS
jgi:integrase